MFGFAFYIGGYTIITITFYIIIMGWVLFMKQEEYGAGTHFL